MTLKEIEARKKEILKELDKDDLTEERMTQLEEEVDNLEEEKRTIEKTMETRRATIARIKNGAGEIIELSPDQKENRSNMDSNEKEYRNAFLKKLQGKTLNQNEERVLTTALDSVGTATPTQTLNMIVEKVYDEAPLIKEIELINVAGNVTFSVEADQTDANIHVEGAEITEDDTVLIPVSLAQFEITKYVVISKSVTKMSIDAFEKWLVNMLAKRIARKITKLIISGTGNNQPVGIDKANSWDAKNSVTIAKTVALTKEKVINLIALLPGGYDKNAKWLMSKKTLYTDFRPLQDNATDSFFTKENGKYYIEGYEVMIDDEVSLGSAYLGDFKMYVGNMTENITVDTGTVLKRNSYEFLGCAMFDGKPALGEAFVKLIKATA